MKLLPTLEPGQKYGMDVCFSFWHQKVMNPETRMYWILEHLNLFKRQTGVDANRIYIQSTDYGEGRILFEYIPGGGDLQILKKERKKPPVSLALARWMISEWVRRIQRSPRLVGLVPESIRGPRP